MGFRTFHDNSPTGLKGHSNAQVSFGDTLWCLHCELSSVGMGFAIIAVERSVIVIFAARAD
jgi:hypothetical protein